MKYKKYRVIRDNFSGYEAQVRYWFFPFWLECFGTNTTSSLEGSKKVIENHKSKVVYIDPK